MNSKRPYYIAACILTGVFLLGFLAGISSHRPIKEVLTKFEMVDQLKPEDFLDSLSRKLTENLNLTEEQQPKVDAILEEMRQGIRQVQRGFFHQNESIQIEAIDKMMEILDDHQKEDLQRKKNRLELSPRGSQVGGRFGLPPGGGPPPGARPPWGGGPPPWGQGPPPGGRPIGGPGGPPPQGQQPAQNPNE